MQLDCIQAEQTGRPNIGFKLLIISFDRYPYPNITETLLAHSTTVTISNCFLYVSPTTRSLSNSTHRPESKLTTGTFCVELWYKPTSESVSHT